LEGVALVPLPESGDRRIRLEETHRRQTAIEAAVAKTHGGLRAVLTPDASRWLGRELRVGVELVDDGGAIHRVGFLPREVGVEVEPRLRALESAGQAATLPAVVPDVHRPFTVELRL
ncbi:MAG: hypothetical protein Q7T71_10600, partial [Herbiconiux sp.]|nr:hypothetical protein [Herbiconiux sp.]